MREIPGRGISMCKDRMVERKGPWYVGTIRESKDYRRIEQGRTKSRGHS